MADYYPLLSRAVSGLPVSNPETRRAIYERASKALLGQLRAIEPPIPAADIEREENALRDAIARLEAELAPVAEVAGMDAIEKALRELSAPTEPPPYPAPAASSVEPPSPAPKAPASLAPKAPPAGSPKAPPAPAANAPAAAAPRLGDSPGDATRPAGPVVTPAAPRPRASGRIGGSPAGSAGRNRTFMAAGLAAALIVIGGGVGFFAWKTRVKPSELRQPRVAQTTQPAAEPSARPATQEPAAPSQPKVESRASNRVLPEGQSEPAPAQQSGAASAAPPAAPAQPEAARQGAPAQEASVPVAQRSAILIASPTQDNPQNVQTFVGNVVWRADTINRGPGQPLSHAVRADIDIPDAKFSAVMTIEKNTDSTLPASHTVTWRFQRGEDSPIPEIAETDTLQMRDDSSPQVEPMAGARARITSNIFIIALASGELLAKRNIDLLEKKGWFDLPLRASDGRLAKITVEKGGPGDRVIKEALARWEQ